MLVDAGEAGENASGRNSGFAIDLLHNVGSSLDELDGSHRFKRLARMAIHHLEDVVITHDIAWTGRVLASITPQSTRAVRRRFWDRFEKNSKPLESLMIGLKATR